MSVVNKMLQDLEHRQANEQISADYQPAPKSTSYLSVLLIVAIVGLLISVLWVFKDDVFSRWGSQADLTKPIPLAEVAQPQVQETTAETSAAQEPVLATQPQTLTASSKPSSGVQPVSDPVPEQGLTSSQTQLMAQDTTSTAVTTDDSALTEIRLTANKTNQTHKEQRLTDDVVAISPAKAGLPGQQDSSQELPKSVLDIRSNVGQSSLANIKQRAQLAVEQGNTPEAIRLLKEILDKEPDNQAVRKKMAALLFSQGQKIKAQQVLSTGLERDPDAADIRLMLARLHVQMKDNQSAYKVLSAYPVSGAVHPDYISYRASLAQQLEQFGEAKNDYLMLIQSQPSNSKWWLGLAICEEKLGNIREALQAYKKTGNDGQLSAEVKRFVQQRIHYLAGVE